MVSNVLFTVALFVVLAIVFLLIVYTFKDNKRKADRVNPNKANRMYYHGPITTPPIGEFFVRVSKYQWIIIHWDKNKGYLEIARPPKSWCFKKNMIIHNIEKNWMIVAEHQPKVVKVEDYFVRQVM